MYKLGIDLGGTKTEGVVLDANGSQIFRERVATEREQGYHHILENVQQLYRKMALEIGEAPHTFGIGTPGSISQRSGLMRNSNTQCLNGEPVKVDLEKLLGRPIVIQNDANCFALAEAVCGAATKYDLVFGIIMGTGCGGGIVYKKQVITGRHAIAGEWGHTSIDPNGTACWCGQRGCLETAISGGGLEHLYTQQFGERLSFTEIMEKFRQGKEPAVEFVQTFLATFGKAVSNLINLLDPDAIVIGGGLSNIDELYTIGVQEAASRIFCDYFDTPILRHKLGDSAGVIGAALIGC